MENGGRREKGYIKTFELGCGFVYDSLAVLFNGI